MKKNFTEIEEIIENRIAELEEEYDLDRWDIQEIRTEAYRENGWSGDPFPLDEEEEEEPGEWLWELIQVMLYQEIYKRRCDHRKYRRKFY